MPVKLAFRKDGTDSPFRKMLHQMLTSPTGDSAILCSGYIWETTNRYAVLADGLLPVIQSACTSGELTTVAGRFTGGDYRKYYQNFVSRIRASGVTVHAKHAPDGNWHAKIAIRTHRGRPIAALIGSSNLTRPAYGLNIEGWNFEADVLIWLPSSQTNDYFSDDSIQQELGKLELVLNPEATQPTEEEQLEAILSDVMDTQLEDFAE